VTAWGGGLVFVVLAAMTWVGAALGAADLWVTLALGFGAIQLSFMGGARWGHALKILDGKSDFGALGAALVPGAAGWLALAISPLAGAALQLAAFLLQALWDLISAQNARLPYWLARLRIEVAGLAVVALLIILGGVIFLPPQ
jgi:hypothetical protein